MANITLHMNQVREIGLELDNGWNKTKEQVNVSGKALYSIIALKRNLSGKGQDVQQTMCDHALAIGGEWTPEGAMKIPPEKIDEMNEWLSEFNKETMDIEYTPIKLVDKDVLPPTLMDLLFDFIEMEND